MQITLFEQNLGFSFKKNDFSLKSGIMIPVFMLITLFVWKVLSECGLHVLSWQYILIYIYIYI